MFGFLKLMDEGGGSADVPVIRHEDFEGDSGGGDKTPPPQVPRFEPTPPGTSASDRIEPGEPLPSQEELAKRYQIGDDGKPKADKPYLVYQGKSFETEKDFNEYMESQSRPKFDENALLSRWRQEQEEREERLIQRLLKEGVGGRQKPPETERPTSRIPKATDNPFDKNDNPDEHWAWEMDRRDALSEARMEERLAEFQEQNETVSSRVEELRDRAERAELIGAFDEMFEHFTDKLRVPERARPLLHRAVMTDPNIDARRLSNVEEIISERWKDLQSYTDGTEADRGKELITKSGKVTASPLRGSAAHLIRGKVKEERPGKMEGDSSFFEHWKRRQAAERLATEE